MLPVLSMTPPSVGHDDETCDDVLPGDGPIVNVSNKLVVTGS